MQDTGTLMLMGTGILFVLGIIFGWGQNRKVVIFENYDDLGLSFLTPAIYLGMMITSSSDANSPVKNLLSLGLFLFGTWALICLLRNTWLNNNRSIWKTLVALFIKIPLSLLWIISLWGFLNPQGSNHEQRSRNRSDSLLSLTFLTFIIANLVVEKTGNYFAPIKWLKYKRVGSLRDHL